MEPDGRGLRGSDHRRAVPADREEEDVGVHSQSGAFSRRFYPKPLNAQRLTHTIKAWSEQLGLGVLLGTPQPGGGGDRTSNHSATSQTALHFVKQNTDKP